MARNGQGVYSKPSGTTAVAQTLIQSAKFNELMDDIVEDLNLERPIVAGGTGANSEEEARENLGVDAAVAFATKSTNYTAVAADNNAIHRFSAAATLTLTAAATLTANWHYTVIADGGAVTIDPNGSETVNGSATQVIPQGFTATIICDGSNFRTTSINSTLVELSNAGVGAMAGHLAGYTLSNNATDATNDIDIAAGTCMDSTNSYVIKLASGITKRLDALWAVGTGQGGLDTGGVADGTYHVFVIKRLDTNVVDILFSTSATSPTLPTSYTIFRRIGSIFRASSTILAFTQKGDEFLLSNPVLDVDTTQSTSGTLRELSVPAGITVWAKFRIRANNSGGAWSLIASSPDVTDNSPSGTTNPLHDLGGASGVGDRSTLEVRTNTSRQIRTRASVGSTDIQISTYGWVDTRGK